MEKTTSRIGLFKKHIDDFSADLNAKAGRTKAEIRKMVGDKPLYKMSSNENALGPSPKAMKAIQEAIPTLHEYSQRIDIDFREKLADYHQNGLTADHFFTGNAGLDIIEMIVRAFMDPGHEAIFTNPTFHVYELFASLSGGKVVNVPLLADSFDLDVEGILEATNQHTRLIFLGNPNNPVGKIIPKAQLEYLLKHLPEGVIVVHDEVYHHFAHADDYPNAADYVHQGYPIIAVNSFSKAFGLAGLRVGYAYTNNDFAHYLRKLRRPFHINALSTVGAIAALDDVEHVQAIQEVVRVGRALIYQGLERHQIKYWDSHTNFILFKSPLSLKGDRIPVDDFIAYMLGEGIMVRSGDNNGAPGCIRLTIGKADANQAFLKALDKLMQNQ
ncbi:MAG: histidinol-phosphate transaminase [Bacteroidota bacterium]